MLFVQAFVKADKVDMLAGQRGQRCRYGEDARVQADGAWASGAGATYPLARVLILPHTTFMQHAGERNARKRCCAQGAWSCAVERDCEKGATAGRGGREPQLLRVTPKSQGVPFSALKPAMSRLLLPAHCNVTVRVTCGCAQERRGLERES